mgnify:CR=1 FL=1
MAHIDIEKKIKDILFERGMILTYKEAEDLLKKMARCARKRNV